MNYLGTKIRVRFSGNCLKQDKIVYTHGKIVNIYIVYEINKKDSTTSSDPTLENCLFDAVTLTKNVNIDKYGVLVMELDLIEDVCINFWSRYEFFYPY